MRKIELLEVGFRRKGVMSNVEHIEIFIEYFEILEKKFFNNISQCGKMWCSTCGGYGHYILKKISKNKKYELYNLINNSTFREYQLFQKWKNVLDNMFPNFAEPAGWEKEKRQIQLRQVGQLMKEIDAVDKDNIREMDQYLFYNRYNYESYFVEKAYEDTYGYYMYGYRYKPFERKFNLLNDEEKKKYQLKYQVLIQKTIATVEEIEDESLIESLAIILKNDIYKYPKLLALCKKTCNKRVQYNCLERHDMLNMY